MISSRHLLRVLWPLAGPPDLSLAYPLEHVCTTDTASQLRGRGRLVLEKLESQRTFNAPSPVFRAVRPRRASRCGVYGKRQTCHPPLTRESILRGALRARCYDTSTLYTAATSQWPPSGPLPHRPLRRGWPTRRSLAGTWPDIWPQMIVRPRLRERSAENNNKQQVRARPRGGTLGKLTLEPNVLHSV